MTTAFLLQHLHTLADGCEDVKIIGIYSSRAEAEAAISRLRLQPGFGSAPELVEDNDGFYISGYEINEDNWREGFVTV